MVEEQRTLKGDKDLISVLLVYHGNKLLFWKSVGKSRVLGI